MDTPVPNFANAHVLVVGDVMLDRYWHGPASRISPEAPVPVVRIDQIEERPGGAANVALNIASLGAKVTLIGVTGDDEAADTLTAELEAVGISCRFQRCKQFPTVTKLRVLSRHQQLIRLDFERAFDGYNAAVLLDDVTQQLANADVVVLSDYGKGTLESSEALITAAKQADKPVLVDPKGTDFSRYHGATLITPNLSEFEAVAGHCSDEGILVMSANALLEEHGLEALLVTRGEHGMSLIRRGETEFHLPAQAREVYDVTGAGDTVISVLAAALAAGAELHHATALANVAAGIVVGKLGTAAVSAPELLRAVHDGKQTGRGVLSHDQLMLAVKDARAGAERIVMTNGCFDILHAGHVAYLEQARQLGDRLIVAVNDDDSVRGLKGSGRPINMLDRRMAVLSALQCVDWVVPFSGETPEALICAVLPDVLVKGGDYTPEQIAGHKCVQANGGEVTILKYLEGHSTSEMIASIKGDDA